MSDIFQVPSAIENIKTMSKNTLRLQVDTQEVLSPEAMKRIFEMHKKLGWFLFAERQIQPEDLIKLPELKPTDEIKTPSQRLRAIIFRMWEQNNEGFKDSESHYRFWMEKISDWLKEKLNK